MFENDLPLTKFFITTVIDQPTELTVKIQSRRAKLSDNPANTPAMPNVWRYVIAKEAWQLAGTIPEDNDNLLETPIGPIIKVKRGTPLTVTWVNELGQDTGGMGGMMPPGMAMGGAANLPGLAMPPINPLPMAYANADMLMMNPSVGVVTHLHGGQVPAASDGWPLAPLSYPGNPFQDACGEAFPVEKTVLYPNNQRAAMLWFHDHGMDNTAPQVYAGLAGLYFIVDGSDEALAQLMNAYNTKQNGQAPSDEIVEIPLVLQDRMVDGDVCCVDYWAGIPTQVDYSKPDAPVLNKVRPEFLGETVFVNGRAWPRHNVTQKVYRLRLLNGSNARTYALALINPTPWTATPNGSANKIAYSDLLTVIGNETGLYASSRTLGEKDYLLLAPGERLDVLLDLTGICAHEVSKLRLVNLAVQSVFNNEWPEAIFQAEDQSIYRVPNNFTLPKGVLDQGSVWLNTLLAVKQANVMQFCIEPIGADACACTSDNPQLALNRLAFKADLEDLLVTYAQQDTAFDDPGQKALTAGGAVVAANRLVLLMNNTNPVAPPKPGEPANKFTGGDWQDTQIWEMLAADGNADNAFKLPFSVPLDTNGIGSASGYQPYKVARSTFLVAGATPIARNGQRAYADLHPPTFTPTAGTYERWYVANIGNWQPGTDAAAGTPDMHPFHIHLVSFVVLRRFSFQAVDASNPVDYQFVEQPLAAGYDNNIRHDTVRIYANEMVELLVYFPASPCCGVNYTGRYPYHCHLVEHEDMGMMLHVEVLP